MPLGEGQLVRGGGGALDDGAAPHRVDRMSIRPCARTTASTAPSTWLASSASATWPSARPLPRDHRRGSSSRALSVSTPTTRPPSPPMIRAVARPMPLPAAVISCHLVAKSHRTPSFVFDGPRPGVSPSCPGLRRVPRYRGCTASPPTATIQRRSLHRPGPGEIAWRPRSRFRRGPGAETVVHPRWRRSRSRRLTAELPGHRLAPCAGAAARWRRPRSRSSRWPPRRPPCSDPSGHTAHRPSAAPGRPPCRHPARAPRRWTVVASLEQLGHDGAEDRGDAVPEQALAPTIT